MDKIQSKLKNLTKKQRIRLSIIAGVVAVLLLIVVFIFSQGKQKNTGKEKGYQLVELKKADPLTFKGVVQATTTQNYYYDQTLGKITGINVTDGQKVDGSTVLLTYDNPQHQEQADEQSGNIGKLKVAVTNAEETLNAAQEKQAKAQQQVNEAITNYNNTNENTETGAAKKEGYRADIKQGEAAVDAAQEAVSQARQSLNGANSELNSANQTINNIRSKVTTRVTSTTNGVAYINERGKNDPSVPVVQVVSNEVSVEGTASEYDYDQLKQDAGVTIKPISSNQQIGGTITHINQLPEQATSAVPSSGGAGAAPAASVSNYHFTVKLAETLQYGYNVQITLPVDEIRLPKKAVITEGVKHFAFVDKKGKAAKKAIKVEEKNGYCILKGGLKEKEQIVANPDEKLKDGQELAVK